MKGDFDLDLTHQEDNRLFFFESHIALPDEEVAQLNWNFGEHAFPKESKRSSPPSVRYTESGLHQIWLEVKSEFGCINQTSLEIEVEADKVFDISNSIVSAFPNPFMDKINISINQDEAFEKANSIIVTDAKGSLVYKDQMDFSGLKEFDFKQFVPGVYFLRVQSENFDQTVEIVKINAQGN